MVVAVVVMVMAVVPVGMVEVEPATTAVVLLR